MSNASADTFYFLALLNKNDEAHAKALQVSARIERCIMTDLSDRQHDAFDNAAKTACREGNLRVLHEAAYLLWEDGDRARLRCDWCELMGATGERTIDLLEREGVLAPGGFVGVDLDPARIDGFRRRRPDLKWVAGNLYEQLEAAELANVGVLNLDAYGEIGDPDSRGDELAPEMLSPEGSENAIESGFVGVQARSRSIAAKGAVTGWPISG